MDLIMYHRKYYNREDFNYCIKCEGSTEEFNEISFWLKNNTESFDTMIDAVRLGILHYYVYLDEEEDLCAFRLVFNCHIKEKR